jgi:hypothetical protein
VSAEREQARLIPAHEVLECRMVAAPHQDDEALVGLQAQKRRAPVQPADSGVIES